MVGSKIPPTQQWLDENQYTKRSILRYEKIFGHNWVSTGGEKTTREYCTRLKLQPGQSVLDVGCGTGGSAFYMAEHYGAIVTGVDLSSHMIQIANERLAQVPKDVQSKVNFRIEDVTTSVYPLDSFDVIYSRDTILHIAEKEALFTRLRTYLKPGGVLFVTDYCRGDQQPSRHFEEYVANRGYDLRTVSEYGALLANCGYRNVQTLDMTSTFNEILGQELSGFEKIKDEFIKEFSEKDYAEIADGWQAKQKRCGEGDQAWGLFQAVK